MTKKDFVSLNKGYKNKLKHYNIRGDKIKIVVLDYLAVVFQNYKNETIRESTRRIEKLGIN